MTVRVTGGELSPITSFKSLDKEERFSPLYCKFSEPTPIQQYAWPALKAKRDMIGISETGSGKTLAFSLPILRQIFKKKYNTSGQVRWVTIAPTRELALQTFEVIKAAIPAVCLYGGVPKRQQVFEIRETKPVAIVATPGRLQDLIDTEDLNLSNVRFLVLDEADRMLDAGFEPAVSAIVSKIPSKRQTILFSATWPPAMEKMASKYLKSDPVHIYVTSANSLSENQSVMPSGPQANTRISQIVHVVEPSEKDEYLLEDLSKLDGDKAIVFVLYKKEAPRVEALLRREGFKVGGLHGDLGQAERTAALAAFKSGKINVLVATDVAARGLDIPAVSLVFNYTFPLTIEDYVHRIGRTGRGGNSGCSVTLFTALEKGLAGALQNVLKQANQVVPSDLLQFGCTTKRRMHKDYGAFYNEDSGNMPAATRIQFSDSE